MQKSVMTLASAVQFCCEILEADDVERRSVNRSYVQIDGESPSVESIGELCRKRGAVLCKEVRVLRDGRAETEGSYLLSILSKFIYECTRFSIALLVISENEYTCIGRGGSTLFLYSTEYDIMSEIPTS
jgi:hypothetical protein